MALKANNYISMAEAADWLNIDQAIITPLDSKYKAKTFNNLEMMINAACDKVESIIKTTVLYKQYTEDHDGNNSNVVVPHHWPVQEVSDIRIDMLRQFPVETKLDSANYFVRDRQDIVLRDDNEKFILGRVFAGSSLGSIRIVYKAGWGVDATSIPYDIKIATLQLVEFWFLQRDARDINVSSKSVKGESYSKMKDGIPEQIFEVLSQYEDLSLGDHPVPQRNTFKI
jgi:hypothetical protein